jgi:hypothetical protein
VPPCSRSKLLELDKGLGDPRGVIDFEGKSVLGSPMSLRMPCQSLRGTLLIHSAVSTRFVEYLG